MKLKTKLFPLLGTIAVATPIAMVVSCGGSTDKFSKTYTFEKMNWNNFQYEDATIVKWIDGDTFTCKADKDGATFNIRVEFIDTPESHVKDAVTGQFVDTKGVEFAVATKAQQFGIKEIPVGNKVRLAVSPGMSYNRVVASVFYGENFEKSYEVNILRQGLALPMITASGLYGAIKSESDLLHYLAVPLADAYNYALENKLGLFETSTTAFDSLKVHGSTDLDAVTIGKPKNIYSYSQYDYWK